MRHTFGFKEDCASVVLAGRCLDEMGRSYSTLSNANQQYLKLSMVSTEPYPVVSPYALNNLKPFLTYSTSETALIVTSNFKSAYQSTKSEPLDSWVEALEELYENLERGYTRALVERLKFLAEPSDDPYDPVMSYGSLKHFINFIKAHNLLKPELVLSFEGNIRAEWRIDRAHHFAAEFLPDGFAKFVFFDQSANNSKKIERVAGSTSLNRLWGFMQMTKAKWCFE